jgi:hypothetical protein
MEYTIEMLPQGKGRFLIQDKWIRFSGSIFSLSFNYDDVCKALALTPCPTPLDQLPHWVCIPDASGSPQVTTGGLYYLAYHAPASALKVDLLVELLSTRSDMLFGSIIARSFLRLS